MVDDDARRRVAREVDELVRRRGHAILEDPVHLRAILRDLLPADGRAVDEFLASGAVLPPAGGTSSVVDKPKRGGNMLKVGLGVLIAGPFFGVFAYATSGFGSVEAALWVTLVGVGVAAIIGLFALGAWAISVGVRGVRD